MSIQWNCVCGKMLKAPDSGAGKRAKCPKCGEISRVPEPLATDFLDTPQGHSPILPPPVAGPAPSDDPFADPDARFAQQDDPFAETQSQGEQKPFADDYGVAYDMAPTAPPPIPTARRSIRAGNHEPDFSSDPDAAGAITPPPLPYAGRHTGNDSADNDRPGATLSQTWRQYTYMILALAMLPLLIFTFNHSTPRQEAQRVLDTMKHNEEALGLKKGELASETLDSNETGSATTTDGKGGKSNADKEDEGEDEEDAITHGQFIHAVMEKVPDHRIEGALLAYDTSGHWVIGAFATIGFLALLLLMFDPGTVKPHHLLFSGLFTATVGIVLLLGCQYLAGWLAFSRIRGYGKIVALLFILKLIGMSYVAADNPENGFLVSFLGFAFGVGLCEELCKALPLLWRINHDSSTITWKQLMLWGLASGIGFGVAEGIIYSGRYYNGLDQGGIYVVRFVSCVALHATWSGTLGILLYANRDKVGSAESKGGLIFMTILFAMLPMLLHALYDTLLKKEMELGALGVAVFSVGVLVLAVEWAKRKLPDSTDEQTIRSSKRSYQRAY